MTASCRSQSSTATVIRASPLTLVVPAVAGDVWRELLDADFDDKTPDQPIGTGDAAVGDPVHISTTIDAMVRH